MPLIYCQKLKREGEQLKHRPFPNALGDRVYMNICQEAWDMWIEQQTILLNQHRLVAFRLETQSFLAQKMEAFLFADDAVVENVAKRCHLGQ